jgi:DNA-directed RNA polymerase specialized sigma24 family protein
MDAAVRHARKEVLVALREAGAASTHLTSLLTDVESVVRETIAHVKGGSSALELAESMDMANRREIVNAAADRMRKSRHEVQRSIFLLALAEGVSRAEIARVWRVSRQLVSRMTGEEAKATE